MTLDLACPRPVPTATHDVPETPYADALRRFAARDIERLNVPGHAGSRDVSPLLADVFGEDALRLDVSPLVAGIDLGADSPLDQSVSMAARAWHARRVWFLTNGASQANRMAALALAAYRTPAQTVVAQRSAHSSFIDGIILGGIDPRFVLPAVDERHGIHHGITPAHLAAALDGSGAKAAYVVSPSYFGAVADIAGLARVCHDAGIPLVVDAAWGAHFGFHPELPANPLDLGADLVVSSTHKMGGSLTQSAMLHLGDGPFADALEPLLERAFLLLQSTSMSSLLLASLDLARASLETGAARIDASIRAADALRAAIRERGRFGIVSDGFGAFDDIVDADPLRVSIDVGRAGLDGHAVRDALLREAGIHVEISTHSCVVAFVAPGVVPDVDRVLRALDVLAPIGRLAASAADAVILPQPGPAARLPRDAAFAPAEIVPASAAIGRISTDSLAAYPPGIPNVLPGETITAQTVRFLRRVAAAPGGHVRGAADPRVDTFRVVAEH